MRCRIIGIAVILSLGLLVPLAAQQALRQMLDSAELARVNSDG